MLESNTLEFSSYLMKTRIIAMIPARVGSERLKMKNLALINGKPLIYYSIKAAKDSGIFDKIVLNSDSQIFGEIALRYDIDFYLRPRELGFSETKSDDVVADFMKSYSPNDIVVWVNTVNPFQSPEIICEAVKHFLDNKLDSLMTVEEKQVHVDFEDKPLNYNVDQPFFKTQDISPVKPFVYSVMMWRVNSFLSRFQKNGYALFCGKFGTYKVGGLVTIKIKTEEDLLFADKIMRGLEKSKDLDVLEYDELVK